MRHDPADVAAAAQLACVLEVTAPKPGNVSPGRDFDDLCYEDFLASAAAIGPALAGACERSLGSTIRLAIAHTARWVATNSNLGIVLLLAPLARAAMTTAADETADAGAEEAATRLRGRVRRVLDETTVDDAREVYGAIRLASPGGLGRAESQDVSAEPTVTLLEAMRLAAERDGIAREYATGFAATFTVGAPALRRARCDGLTWPDAIVETFLTLLAAAPDTHVIRRGGSDLGSEISRRAAAVLAAGGVRSDDGRAAIRAMDAALRDPGHRGNPGTTADITAASLFVHLLCGSWR